MALRRGKNGKGNDNKLSSYANNRRNNDRAILENPLDYLTDEELQDDVQAFVDNVLPSVSFASAIRAARVAKDIRRYYEVAMSDNPALGAKLPVLLTMEEKIALQNERTKPFSERGMRVVVLTVSLAALLQGFVQSSINGASLYGEEWGLCPRDADTCIVDADDWRLGAANASPFLFAALVGCPLSLPINYWYGRRGGLIISASLIAASSLAAIFANDWLELFGVRFINGIGMGIKAVSTPILAGETAVGFWRGSTVLAWQLWVACGIMLGFAFNLMFTQAVVDRITYRLINSAPLIPSLALLGVTIFMCPESPRYHLMKGPNYSPEKAYQLLRGLRNTELQALRDMYTVHKALQQELMGDVDEEQREKLHPGLWWSLYDHVQQFRQLFQQRRLYNAVISTMTVNLAQQLCGVNVLAFYSGTVFSHAGADRLVAMGYSLAFGAINFLFCLPAVKSIDTMGRRKWLLATLPFMAVFMLGGALAFLIHNDTPGGETRQVGVVALFMFLFAAAYSPGLGPIPFTLASESFPLTHREAGTAWAISTNLVFAGLLSLFFPSINSSLGNSGSLGLFAGLNVTAFIMVFLFVEETKRRNLEDLDLVFAVPKWRFMRFQLLQNLPWFTRNFLFRQKRPAPRFYQDMDHSYAPTESHISRPLVEPPIPVMVPSLTPRPSTSGPAPLPSTPLSSHPPMQMYQPPIGIPGVPVAPPDVPPGIVEIGDARSIEFTEPDAQ